MEFHSVAGTKLLKECGLCEFKCSFLYAIGSGFRDSESAASVMFAMRGYF